MGNLDDMEHEAKYQPHPIDRKIALLREALITLNHARIFIATREKMHPTGIALYDDLVSQIEEVLR